MALLKSKPPLEDLSGFLSPPARRRSLQSILSLTTTHRQRRNSDTGAHGCESIIALWDFESGDNIPRPVCETQSCMVGIRRGNGFLGTSGHRQMMNPSVVNLQHRLVLELSVGLSFDQRQAPWRIDLFWQQLQAFSALSCRSPARNLLSSGYTQSTCSKGGGPCEGFEKRWRTTTTSVRGV